MAENPGKDIAGKDEKRGVNCNLRAVPAYNGAPGWCVLRDSWGVPGNVSAYQAEAIAQPP